MARPPLEYLLEQFAWERFPDLFTPLWVAALVLLIVQIVVYNVRTRQLHRHPPLVNMQEWLFWTGLITFSFLLVATVFRFYFVFVVLALLLGLATYIWVRFVRFPPYIEAYNEQLRRARFFSQSRYRHPEATVRARQRSRRRRR